MPRHNLVTRNILQVCNEKEAEYKLVCTKSLVWCDNAFTDDSGKYTEKSRRKNIIWVIGRPQGISGNALQTSIG